MAIDNRKGMDLANVDLSGKEDGTGRKGITIPFEDFVFLIKEHSTLESVRAIAKSGNNYYPDEFLILLGIAVERRSNAGDD